MKFAIVPALLALSVAASAQGPDAYRALGTEPFWGLTIDAQTMRLDQPGARSIVVSAPAPRPTFNGRRYETRAMTVDVTAAPCSDGMSDRRYPERVTVSLGRRTLTGCGGDPVGAPVTGQRLEGPAWAITAIDGQRVAIDGATLRFDGASVAGNAGCNRFSAPYTLDAQVLRIGLVRATRMACAGPGMAAENRVMAAFAEPLRVRWIGRGTVVLGARGGGIVLTRTSR